MAGTIEISPESSWTAASWLFDWVLTRIANELDDLPAGAEVRLIVAENLGFLSVGALGPSAVRVIADFARSGRLVDSAEAGMFAGVEHASVVAHVRELSEALAHSEPA